MDIQEKNKAIQKRFIQEFQTLGNFDILDEIVADDFIDHSTVPGFPPGKEGIKDLFRFLRSAFHEFRTEIHDMIAEGDKVCTRKSFYGIHNGDYMGIPATGKPVRIGVVDIVSYKNGKIVEHWNVIDQVGLMQQLGVIPS